MPQQFLQAPATSYCLLDDVCIFLDRRSDKYHYLDREKTKLLDNLRNGLRPNSSSQKNETSSTFNIAEELVTKKLLTTKHNGKTLDPVVHQSPYASVYDKYWQRSLHPMTIVLLASKHNALQSRLKNESLYETTQKAEKLKSKISNKNPNISDKKILKKARKIIDCRYFIYTYKDNCLFDSYLFFEYFIKQAIPVNWVFGVDLYPFAAHCWIEYKGLILNDQLERVSAFKPIYVI